MGRNSPAPSATGRQGETRRRFRSMRPAGQCRHRPASIQLCLTAGPPSPCSDTARSDPGEGIQLSPGPSQTSSVRRGDQEPNLRALRSGRDLARRGDFHDPRPRQRSSRRQPPRESQNRLSELRCDAVNPLRPEEPQLCNPNVSAFAVGRPSGRETIAIATAPVHAEPAGTAEASPDQAREGQYDLLGKCSFRRSKDLVTRPWAGATECPTTRFGSGYAPTSGNVP